MAEDRLETEGYRAENTQGRILALVEVATSLLELGDEERLRALLNTERPADVADLLRCVDDDLRDRIFALLSEEQAAEALVAADVPTLRAIADDLAPHVMSDLVEEMDPDDAADVLAELEDEHVAKILDHMEDDDALEMQGLLEHEEDTGGGLMTPDFVLVNQSATVKDAIQALQDDDETADLFYVFVVDDDTRPVGVVPIHKLVRAKPHHRIDEIMDRDLITVTYDTDQEEIARLFSRYDFMAMPVVDENGRLVGRITVDDVMDVIEEENAEDVYKMAGTSHEESESLSAFGIAKARLPWLMICLAGSILSGAVLRLFEDTLAHVIALTVFLPVITATGGNSGLQSSTVTVRRLITGQVAPGHIVHTVLREIGTATVIGVVCGGIASAVAWFWLAQPLVGIAVGLAMFLAISVAIIMGVMVPLFFDRVGIDPAVASGPFITTTNDILGFFIYLGIASALLHYFV